MFQQAFNLLCAIVGQCIYPCGRSVNIYCVPLKEKANCFCCSSESILNEKNTSPMSRTATSFISVFSWILSNISGISGQAAVIGGVRLLSFL